jgi:hypothetical protein
MMLNHSNKHMLSGQGGLLLADVTTSSPGTTNLRLWVQLRCV